MAIKVCHFTSTHSPKDQRIFYKECISLTKAGYEVYLVEQGNTEDVSGVHIIGTGEMNKSRYYRLLVRPRSVYKLAKKIDADIYHFHDMELIPYGLKLKRLGKKVIFDYHEDYASRFAESDFFKGPKWIKELLAKIYCWYENRAVKKFDAMISVTPHVCDRLAKVNSRTVMVTNYPLLDTNTWAQELSYHEKSDYIAFAGQVSDTYRLTFITEGIQEIPDIRFKICGPQRKADDLEKIKKSDINNKVDYMGTLPYMKIPEFLNNARAALVLSTYGSNTGGNIGTLGNNKLFEAMLCGIPVICTDYILWKEIIDEYQCGICVNSYSTAELRDAVKYILSHSEEAAEMGKNGRNAVKKFFNWNIQEKFLLDLYNSLSNP